MAAAVKGYRCVFTMPDKMSREKQDALKAFGAQVVVTPTNVPADSPESYYSVAKRIAAETPNSFYLNQYHSTDNVEAHYRTTGPEIWEQTEGRVEYFVASQGTGGTITGVARYLKEQDPAVKVFAVEPAECDILSGGTWGPHRIEGIGDGFIPPILDLDAIDGVVTTTSDEAVAMAKRLAREEGIFCGISSGCNVAAALKLAHRHLDAHLIVTMINDNGLRYLSTELCGESRPLEVPERQHPADTADRTRLASRKFEIIR